MKLHAECLGLVFLILFAQNVTAACSSPDNVFLTIIYDNGSIPGGVTTATVLTDTTISKSITYPSSMVYVGFTGQLIADMGGFAGPPCAANGHTLIFSVTTNDGISGAKTGTATPTNTNMGTLTLNIPTTSTTSTSTTTSTTSTTIPGGGGGGGADFSTAQSKICAVLKAIYTLLLYIASGVAALMIVAMGITWISSAENAKARSSAKNGAIHALVGLIVVAVAILLVNVVLPAGSGCVSDWPGGF